MSTASERTPIRKRGLQMIPWSNHDEWLNIRRGYIGGSDAGAIAGLNPYASAFSVWAEKTGQLPEFEGNTATRVGTELEALVARLFMEETGKKVQRLNFTLVNPAYPFACANIDREVLDEDAVLEIKTTSSPVNLKKFRGGEYPEQWYCQCVHYMAVTGAKKCYLAVLVMCLDLLIFEIERDEDEIKALMDAERDFWENYVVPKKTPPVDGHSATSEAIKQMFDTDTGDSADLTDFTVELQKRKAINEHIKALKTDLDALDNRVKAYMGDRSFGVCGTFSVSWKLQNTAGLDREKIKADYPGIDFSKYVTKARVFRVTEKKQKSA